MPNDTFNDNVGNVIDDEISSNDKETLDDEVNVESNVACKKTSTTNRRKGPVRFCKKMKTHEEKGLVKLDPIVFGENSNEAFKHGLYLQCVACHKCRSRTEGNVCLRRPCHIY